MNYQVLLPLIKRLEENNIPYALGGSGLLHYLGLIDFVNDWDIVVECPKHLLFSIINEYDFTEQESGDYPFASQYRISIESLKIDFIGYFALYSDDTIINLPVHSMGKWDIINVSSPELWYVAYYLMNRKSKANIILKYLNSSKEKLNINLIEELIKIHGLNEDIKRELNLLIG
ncbi:MULTISPECIES: hypothetical protein [Paenibacillus]|uniref:Uncharacterized protein n=1 Tax=Paenibacillus illinoisensis TaxID=59845 RepID=A0A2W0CDL5_9BACL|nr:hypothetical protein [Paenibacillus illinoisensis]PYY25878.1 Uncharacterized protein PIL02S_05247 [Paenibacillus illinoisensis]